ncbi:MAG: hypothetical protein KDC49_01315 [Saprospiraceae bacterium]|nr:hypothetical protein [Saprospiraceae bacterium]
MPRNWYDAHVINILDEAPQVKRFFLRLESQDTFTFKAGQFMTFDLPVGEKRLDRWRSYSIASPPTHDQTIELCISRLEGGRGSGYFFDEVAVGTVLKCKGPEGVFLLPETDKKVVMICTGTGIAPFRSMIRDAYAKGSEQQFHLIFGCRKESDILYREEFEALSRDVPEKFSYDVCISREQVEGFHHGYVHQVYEQSYGAGVDHMFMLCGWTPMVDQAKTNLKEHLQVAEGNIICELYG